ncbi:archaellin/type IV pilin N-terminal domain-containing protein [Thermogladius sp. KZ2Tp1]|uniref:archaellin/type IV pilin N-terminal domain-containing protein n=1 Tax=Thermogladius sp. KZ2Tp1 TaxID=3136289 RepID=UPI003DA9D418
MRAISPVIATVIIVAVTIAVAIAVALWMTGLVGGFTGTENLQIVNAYALATTTPGQGWSITLTVKNAGTTTATIDQVFVNGIPYNAIILTSTGTGGATTTVPVGLGVSLPLTLSPGNSTTIQLFIPLGTSSALSFSSGQQVEIKLHTASGKTYPVQVVLP